MGRQNVHYLYKKDCLKWIFLSKDIITQHKDDSIVTLKLKLATTFIREIKNSPIYFLYVNHGYTVVVTYTKPP